MNEVSWRLLAITLGDPYSINLEVLLPLLVRRFKQRSSAAAVVDSSDGCDCHKLVLFGSYALFQAELVRLHHQNKLRPDELRWLQQIPLGFDFSTWGALHELYRSLQSSTALSEVTQRLKEVATCLERMVFKQPDELRLKSSVVSDILFINTAELAVETINSEEGVVAMSPAQRGWLAYSALLGLGVVSEVIKMASHQVRLAVLTAPICKYEAQLAGFEFPGQTEFFEQLWQGQGIMVLTGPGLTVGLITNHLALKQVPEQITTELVVSKAQRFMATLIQLKNLAHCQQNPAVESCSTSELKVALCGLNPHRSDGGMFGCEEQQVLEPALAALHGSLEWRQFTQVVNRPLRVVLESADVAFYKAMRGDYVGVLACYHDQGLGPLKTVHFDDAVNITGGLRHLRVSPDHGPARDLYGGGHGSPKSFAAALQICMNYLTSPLSFR